jgi:hypothetical protein
MRRYFFLCLIIIQPYIFSQSLFNPPIVGGVTDTKAKIFVRTDASAEIQFIYSKDSLFSSLNIIPFTTQPDSYFFKMIELENLEPLTKYYYKIKINNQENNQIYKFKTFPREGEVGHHKIVVGSCNYSNVIGGGQVNPNYKNDAMFQQMVDFDPNIIIHLGDWNYPPAAFGAYHLLNENLAAESFSLRYRDYNMATYLMPNFPIDYIYDDDFSQNGTAGWTYPAITTQQLQNGDAKYVLEDRPLPIGLRDSAIKNYFKFFPSYNQIDSTGIHHQFKLGHIEFLITDTRNSKDPVHLPFKYNQLLNTYDFKPPTNHSTLGITQKNWLLNALKNTNSAWKIIGSSVIFNKTFGNLMNIVLLGQLIDRSLIEYATSIAYMWPGYPKDQNDLLYTIKQNNIKNTIIISGDSHSSMLDDGRNAGIPELSSSGWSASNEGYLNGQIDSLLQLVNLPITTKDFLWNGGGNGVANKNYSDTYGTIEVFYKDSLTMCVHDEFLQTLGCITLKYQQTREDSTITSISGYNTFLDDVMTMIYPNPAKDRIKVVLNLPNDAKNINYSILDINGNVLENKEIEQIQSKYIDIHLIDYSIGTYFLQLKIDNQVHTKKFLVR